MDIKLTNITVHDLTSGYADNAEDGVVGFGGHLDIRPAYQREFIYKDRQRDAVIETVSKGFPLNVMYWAVRDHGGFELIDGQQRTISICQYIEGDFSVGGRYFYNLQDDEQNQILDYQLAIYRCTGTNSEKLEWFQTINIAGEKLTQQELRNAIFHGSWVSDAKRHFSKTGCPAYTMAGDYLAGSAIRQEYLQTVIGWISNGAIDDYMGLHQHDPKATELWDYFVEVTAWVKATFPKYRSDMKGVAWGDLYNQFGHDDLDPAALETRVVALMADDEVERKKGIYTYVLTGEEKWLNLRQFRNSDKRSAYERQKGVCPVCKETFAFEGMEADHKKPWRAGGKTTPENCQMLCIRENRLKSGY
jgi:Protein of unknown function DUF262/HNH endonuclease